MKNSNSGKRSYERTLFLVVVVLPLAVFVVLYEFYTQWSISNNSPEELSYHPSDTENIRRTENGMIGGFNNNTLRRGLTKKNHIAFLKVHKAASSTVQNIFYRFGFERNLSFALPAKGHNYISKNSKSYSRLLAPFDNITGKYDIICNHVIFNSSKFKSLMYDDAFYVAIVREPMSRFVSAAYYYRYVFRTQYLKKLNNKTMLHDLITHPEIFEPKNLKQSKTFNIMARDFGLALNSLDLIQNLDEVKMNDFVSNLMQNFDFVMIVEKLDESLVMLKRYLGWSIKDILYITRNTFESQFRTASVEIQNVTDTEKEKFKKLNHLDYLIYERFFKRFLNQMSEEENLDAEVKEFKRILKLVETFCTLDKTGKEVVLLDTKFDKRFRVSRHDCKLMMLMPVKFCSMLEEKHRLLLRQTMLS